MSDRVAKYLFKMIHFLAMSNRVYFDQTVIQKDFASFNENELFGNIFLKAFLSLFNKDQNNNLWNKSFHFATDSNGDFAVIGVSQYLYHINLKQNKIKFQTLPYNKRCNSICFSDKLICVLSNSVVFNYSFELEYQNQTQLKCKGEKLLRLNNKMYILANTSLFNYPSNEAALQKLPSYDIALSSKNSIILLGSSMTVIMQNMSTITPSIPFKNPLDAAFSVDESLLFVLDQESKIFVFDTKNAFKVNKVIELNGVTYLLPWDSKHIVAYNDYGSLYFVAIGNNQTQQQTIKPNSVLRGINEGFLLLELSDESGDSFHFDLLKFASVTPDILYQRNCEKGFFGDALVLQRTFKLDKDIYYKEYLKQNQPLTVQIVEDNLEKINDKKWIYQFCCDYVAESVDVTEKLIKFGLSLRPNDQELVKQKERLHIYLQIYKRSGYKPEDWKQFRSCVLENKAIEWAKKSLFREVDILFKSTSEITEANKRKIISYISPFVSPMKFAFLLPREPELFRTKANDIDELTGQTSLIVELFEYGSNFIPEIKVDLDFSREFDAYINEIAEGDNIYLKYSDYLKMNDDNKLLLFVRGSRSGEILLERIQKYGSTILKRSNKSLSYILTEPFQSKSSVILPGKTTQEKIKDISIVLNKQGIKFSKSSCQSIISQLLPKLNKEIILAIQNNWMSFLSNELIIFLKFAYFATTAKSQHIQFTTLSLDPSLILSVANDIIQNSIKEWKEFYSFSKQILQTDKKYQSALKELNLSAQIILQDFENVIIETPTERNIVVMTVQKLIDKANSCDIEDPNLAAAIECLAMVPNELKNDVVNTIFKRLSLYKEIFLLDKKITPHQVNQAKDINLLIESIINSGISAMKKPNKLSVGKYCELVYSVVKNMDGINQQLISTLLSNICLNYDCLEFATKSFLGNADDETKLKYINDKRWNNDKEKELICDMGIINSSKDLLPQFVEYKSLRYSNDISDPSTILNFVATNNFEKDSKITNMAIECLPKEKHLIELLEDHYNSGKSVSFNSLINKLHSYQLITDEEFNKINSIVNSSLSANEKTTDQYSKVMYAINNGLNVDDDASCRAISLQILQKMNIEVQDDDSVDSISVLVTSKDLSKLKPTEKSDFFSNVLKLLEIWKKFGKLSDSIAVKLLVILPENLLKDKREFITSISNEKIETEYFLQSKNIYFALTSKYQTLTEKIGSIPSLSDEIIDFIIDNNFSYLLTNVNHIEQIAQRVKSKPQLQKVVQSYKAHSKLDGICIFAQKFFQIPPPFVTPPNAEYLCKWIEKIIC